MAISLFGFKIGTTENAIKRAEQIPSFVPPSRDDGAVEIAPGGAYGTFVDLEGTAKSEAELTTRYREMSLQPEVDSAIDDLVNESIITDFRAMPVEIDLGEVDKIPESIKKRIREEFEEVMLQLDFRNMCYEIFRRWYIDGRLFYHIMIDKDRPRDGIQELRYIDPRRIRKVREPVKKSAAAVVNQKNPQVPAYEEYYLYNPGGLAGAGYTQGIKISPDSICYTNSGLLDNRNRMTLSYLHKAIKPLNQLRMLEDALVIYRLSRAPERRIFYIDVGNLPKIKAEQYMRDMMIRHKNRLVYDAQTGEVRDDRKFMCYALDTKIPLLDGRTVSLQELMNEYEDGKKNWVYSCDPVTGKFVPGPVSWAGITKKNSQVVRVTFDNGKSVVCTPDHKFPVWGKGFIEAKDLVGESIIPGYRQMKTMFGDSKYEQIFKNDTNTWEYTHREVARWKDANNIREEKLHREEYAASSKNTIHHIDYNRMNNSPSNLVMMNRDDHMKYHRDCAKYGFGGRINRSEDFTPIWRKRISESRRGKVQHFKTWKIFVPDGSQEIVENLNEYCRLNNLNRSNIKYNHSRGYKAEVLRNHKATSVEWLDEKIDVGCITVDLEETYHSHHTYLLDAGVYTKNTMLEDFWLPRREGARGTEVTTLPGGQNLGQMDDVIYFQKKLYKALNVPISRLESETGFNMGRANEITRDEVKFSKFITRLRHRFSAIFNNLLEVQLALKGVMRREEWRDIKHNIKYNFLSDNSFQELKNQDLMTSRMLLLASVDPYLGKYYSKMWIQKNILHLTEEEVDEMQKEIEQEGPDVAVPGSPMDMQTVQQQAVMAQQQKDAAAQQQQTFPTGGPEEDDGNEPKPLKMQEQIIDATSPPKDLTEEEKKLITSMTRFMDSMAEDNSNV